MKLEAAEVELRFEGRSVGARVVVGTGASRGVISKALSDALGALVPLKEPYELRTADEG